MRIIFLIFFATFMLASVLEAQIVENGLVSYYTLDAKDIEGEVVKDLIGKNDGKIVGAPKSVAGHIGEALEFAGQPDCVELPQVFAIGEGPVSYECWFIKPAKTDWSYLMVNKSDFHNNFFRLGFNQNSGQLRFYTEHENETNKAWVTDEDYADGNWHHVVATRDGNQGKMYVDGKLVKEDVAMDGDIGGDQTSWYLAQDGNTNGYLAGTMDEVRIYNRALAAEEVEQNFESKGTFSVVSMGRLGVTWCKIKYSAHHTVKNP